MLTLGEGAEFVRISQLAEKTGMTAAELEAFFIAIDKAGDASGSKRLSLSALLNLFGGGSSSSFEIKSVSGDSLAEFGNVGVNEFLTVVSNLVKVAKFGDGATHNKLIVDPDGVRGVSSGIWFSDGDSGFYESSNNVIRVITGGVDKFVFTAGNVFGGRESSAAAIINATPSNVIPTMLPNRLYEQTGIGSASAQVLSLIANSIEGVRVEATGVTINNKVNTPDIQEFTDNADALANSLVIGDHYRTGDLLKIVH